MNRKQKKPRNIEVYKAISTLETMEECIDFFDDLCSATELQAMEQRFQVARLLDEGMVYTDILEQTGASSATVSRVNRSLQQGGKGYEVVFERLRNDKETKQ